MAKEIKPFDTAKKPIIPNAFWNTLMRILTRVFTRPVGGKINKINCENLQTPFIVISNHASFIDFPMAKKALGKTKSTWIITIEEFIGKESVMRNIGGIYKRKFTNDVTVVKHVLYSLMNKKCPVVFYPEARYSFAGINEPIDGAIGKLVKKAGCPLVMFLMRGNYLRSPQWNKHPYRDVKVEGDFIQVISKEEAETLTADEIQRKIEQSFVYDEYAWQRENKIAITSEYRAENIHRILYQCPCCKKEYTTQGKGKEIVCNNCGKKWEMDEYGVLHSDGGVFDSVPDWYLWEKQNVTDEVEAGNYRFEDEVYVEKLINSKIGFSRYAETGKLVQDEDGFTLTGNFGGENFVLKRSAESMMSVHIEFDFKGRGDALDLTDGKDTYWVYPKNAVNSLTKIHLAQIALHEKCKRKHAENSIKPD